MRLNSTWLFAGILAVGVAAGGSLATWWWVNRPETLYAAADAAYRKGEEALKSDDPAAASHDYDEAEAALARLLAPQKAPNHSAGWLLRFRVANQQSMLLRKDEEARGDIGTDAPSAQKAAAAWAYLLRAGQDPACVEAQAMLLDRFFKGDSLDGIAGVQPYAFNLIKRWPADGSGPPGSLSYLLGARYVLAWTALNGTPPNPDQALEHLRASEEMQKRLAELEGAAAAPPPRWRAVALEAQALAEKARQQRKARPFSWTPRDKGKEPPLEQDLQARVAAWVERLQKEKDDILPGKKTIPAHQLLTRSATDVRGLLDFLLLAVDQGTTRAEVMERAELTLEVCDRMASAEAAPAHVLGQVATHVALLPAALERQPAARQPTLKERVLLGERLEQLNVRLMTAGTPPAASTYLHLARTARKDEDLAGAERHLRKGLEAAAAQGLAANNATVLDLHLEAAWVLVLQKKGRDADEHLLALRAAKRQGGVLALLEGLAAALDGRLEQGAVQLRLAAKDPAVAQTMHAHLGLAYAALGLGKCDLAVKALEKLDAFYLKVDQLSHEEQLIAADLMPGRDALRLELFRCYLALGRTAETMETKELLRYRPEGLVAEAIWAHAYLATARAEQAAGKTAEAMETLRVARAEVAAARKQHGDDLRLAWAEAVLLLAAGDAGRADEVLRTFADQEKEFGASCARARWLQLRGRWDEAERVLAAAGEAPGPEARRALQVVRCQRELAHGEEETAAKLLPALGGDPQDWSADAVGIAYLAGLAPLAAEQDAGRAGTPTLSRSEENGLQRFWAGQLAQARGDFKEAALAYDRSLSFAAFKAPSQRGVLTSLLALSARESPKVANDVAMDLLTRHPNDPALLLAYAETARLLDRLRGRAGMEGALQGLEAVLTDEGGDPALGAFCLARGWLLSGRDDLARGEVKRALQLDPHHAPTLRLAGPLALAAKDWDAALAYADTLSRVEPDAADALRWRGAALDGQGHLTDAAKAYQRLAVVHPDRADGYLGTATVLEKAGDPGRALEWVARWRTRDPEDANGLRAQVRILASTGRPEAAERVAAAGHSVEANLAAAGGFQDARAFDRAEAWARRGLTLAETLPTDERGERLAALQLALGEACLTRAGQERDADRRTAQVNQAIDAFQAVFKQSPGHAVAGRRLAGLLLKERGDAEAAFAVAEKVRQGRHSGQPVSGDRLDLDLLDLLGDVFAAAGHNAEAAVLFKEAATRYGTEPRVFLHLGRAQAALKQGREAQDSFNRTIRLAKDRAEQDDDRAQWLALIGEATRLQQTLPRPK